MIIHETEKRSKGISNDMSSKAILKRLNTVRDLYEAGKRMSDFHKINSKYGKRLPELKSKTNPE